MRLSFKEKRASEERSRTFMIALGLFGAAMFAAFAYIGFTAPNGVPGRSYYNVVVHTNNGDNIDPHDEVRVDGDIVGQVLDPVVKNGVGQFRMQLDPSVAPLRSDSKVQVVPRSAVGVRYVEVTPGGGTPLKNGGSLGVSQASATEPLSAVLSTFDPATRSNLQKFLRGFGEGLVGEGQNISDALGGAPGMLASSGDGNQPTSGGGLAGMLAASGAGSQTVGGAPAMLQSSDGVLGTLASHVGYTAQLVHGGGILSAANDPVRETIASGFQPEADSLHPFDDRAAVDGTLAQAPPTLTAATKELPAFSGLATQLTGFAKAVTPGLRAGPESLGQTSALLKEAKPDLIEAKTVLGTVGSAVDPTLNLLQTAKPVLAPLQDGLQGLDPLVTSLGDHGCDLVDFGKNWTNGLSYSANNGSGNVLRFEIDADVIYGAKTPSPGIQDDPNPAPCVAEEGKG